MDSEPLSELSHRLTAATRLDEFPCLCLAQTPLLPHGSLGDADGWLATCPD
jgi:hypothetical protein